MTTTNLSGKRLLPGSVDFDKLDAITQATINSLLAGSKRLADIAGVQTNATLNPGASPAAGTRYLLLDVAHLHASFGTIAGVGDGDIVAYSGSAWVVDVDFSAQKQTLNVWNDGDKRYWIGDPEASGVKWTQSLGAGAFPFDPTTSVVPDDKVTVQQALAWLADATDVSVVSVDFMMPSSADVASFTAGAVRNGHTLAAGQKLLVSDSAAPDFKVVYTVQASGAPTVSSMLSEKISLVTVGKSRPAASAGLYVYTPQIGALRQVVSSEAAALQHLDPVFGDRLSVAAALARSSNDIYDELWHVCAYADLNRFTAGTNIGGHVLAAGDRIGVVDFGAGSTHSGEVYTVQASGAPTLTTARRPGRTYFIAWANGYDSLNYPGGVYTCGPGAAGYESYRLSQNSTAGLTHNDPLLGLVTVASKFADQDAKIAAAQAGNPMQYAAEAADGVLKVFTLPFTITANSKIFVDGMLARAGAGNDYTYSGAVVTLNAAGPAPVSWVGGISGTLNGKATYAYVNTPTVTTPTNGQTEVPEQPTLQSSAFATTGGADTHASSQWQIRLAGGTWAAPLHDSGASTTNKTSYTVPAGVLVAGQTQYVMRVRHTGTSLGASEWSSDIAFTTKQQFAQIIGIVCTATGGGAGTWQRVDENFAAITTTAATFNNHPTYAGVVAQTIDGQAMMKVPKYYLKTGTVPSGTYAGKRYWMVSDQPVSGFTAHPAFMNAGVAIDQFWVGKYQGTTDGTKLGSVAGLTPLVSIDFPTMQTRATNRNTGGVTGFGLWNIYQLSAIQTLALIEMGGSDSQALIGQGHVSGSSALATDNATVAQATWRGIVGLWGNVWQMVDGLQTDASSRYKIWDKNGNKTYQTTSLTAPASNYPVTMATATGTDYDLATVFAPETTNATAGNGTYGDYFYQNPSCVAYHGGDWGNGAYAGLFYLNVSYAASYAGTVLGGRLAKV